MTAPNTPDMGFTLLELVAAMAIFALVAVMGLQALSGSLRARDGLQVSAEDSAALTTAIALLRADLDAAIALPFLHPDGSAAPAFEVTPDGLGFALSLAGQPAMPDEGSAGLARVEWRLDRTTGRLLRRTWPVLAPLGPRSARPETAEMAGVIGLDIRAMTAEQGWLAGRDWMALNPGPTLPRGIEITLVQRRFDRVRILVALR